MAIHAIPREWPEQRVHSYSVRKVQNLSRKIFSIRTSSANLYKSDIMVLVVNIEGFQVD